MMKISLIKVMIVMGHKCIFYPILWLACKWTGFSLNFFAYFSFHKTLKSDIHSDGASYRTLLQ